MAIVSANAFDGQERQGKVEWRHGIRALSVGRYGTFSIRSATS